jgi:lycopene beta-cyclase
LTTHQLQFDYIVIGAGLSGLSLLVRLVENGASGSKRILLIDKTFKNRNDKTWCFWERGEGYFEKLVHHQWAQLEVRHPAGNLALEAAPYRYKMIRSIDFYKHCTSIIQTAPNITTIYEEVSAIDTNKGVVTCGERQFSGQFLFSSVLMQQPVLKQEEFYLLQHFMGWMIETDKDYFDPGKAQLMNFNVSQEQGCTFVYVLPVSSRRALVEYTLFSEEELPEEAYEQGLQRFIAGQLGIQQYRITEREKGIIPMTNLHFPQQEGRLFYIGTAGGQTKASTGYTFQFIQKQSTAIVQRLAKGASPLVPAPPKRFRFYDGVLLRVLQERKMPGADVFYRMFRRNKAIRVLKFLDNETNLWEELQIMNASKKSVFIPAALKQLLRG